MPLLHFEFDGVDFSMEDAFVVGDKVECVDDFHVVLMDILDLHVDGVHFIYPLHDLVLLKLALLGCITRPVLIS